jgi:hypothetical protein
MGMVAYDISSKGILERMTYSESDDKFIVRQSQDINAILDDNEKRYNEGDLSWTPSRDMVHAARIPEIVLEKWRLEEGIDWRTKEGWQKVLQKLDEPENRLFRTWPGKIGKRPTRSYPVLAGR